MKKKIVPDTSAVIDGILSKMIEEGKIKEAEIIIHNAVLAELEHQANYGKEIGFLGLEELQKLSEIVKKNKKIKLRYVGKRPTEFQIKYAKGGEIDALIREVAKEEDATFVTLDKVDAEAAKAVGIDVYFIEAEKIVKPLSFEKYFDKETMSVHLKENTIPVAKKGKPGYWKMVKIGKKELTAEDIEKIAKEIVDEGRLRIEDSFIEVERKGSIVAQIRDYRIVITKPPFSDGWEITIVRPIKKLNLEDYNLPKELIKLLEAKAEGIVIAGAPGHGKSTFAQALAEEYKKREKIVKTVEAPRDLRLSPEITQYSKTLGSLDEIRDVLLLSRPDFTIFDEMRNPPDFSLYADLRLAGIGMIGVVHATTPIDAIQRFVKRIELGMIPSIVDTVIFIKDGEVAKVYTLNMIVKVPSGMTESDLARPVVEIKDFLTKNVEYEIYTFGEETVVMPVVKTQKSVKDKIRKYLGDVDVKIDRGVAVVYVPRKKVKKIIGKRGKKIKNLEKVIGIPIEIVGY